MKEIEWLGGSKKALLQFPKEVIQEMGYALYITQKGSHYSKAKSFRGGGSGVYEIATEYNKNAYRVIYIVGLDNMMYVVHSFQKKSKRGIKTPKEEIEVIKQRLKLLRAEISRRR